MKKLYLLLLPFLFILSACSSDSVATPVNDRYVVPMVEEAQINIDIVKEAPVERVDNKQDESEFLSNDNSYVNVDNEVVHSPAYAPSVPSGASAVCRDGTYSFSRHRSGTCSGHGGVARWL